MNYNEDLALAIARNINNYTSQEATEEAVYNELADKGWLINQEDIAKTVKMVQIYEMYRGTEK